MCSNICLANKALRLYTRVALSGPITSTGLIIGSYPSFGQADSRYKICYLAILGPYRGNSSSLIKKYGPITNQTVHVRIFWRVTCGQDEELVFSVLNWDSGNLSFGCDTMRLQIIVSDRSRSGETKQSLQFMNICSFILKTVNCNSLGVG